jgi:hypothetical protein
MHVLNKFEQIKPVIGMYHSHLKFCFQFLEQIAIFVFSFLNKPNFNNVICSWRSHNKATHI